MGKLFKKKKNYAYGAINVLKFFDGSSFTLCEPHFGHFIDDEILLEDHLFLQSLHCILYSNPKIITSMIFLIVVVYLQLLCQIS
jgi:hypothetical protein